jgi:membrane-associated phospholipid phosphatase
MMIKRAYKPVVLLLFFQLVFCSNHAFAQAQSQSPVQQFDDRVLIDLQNQRTPEQTNVFMFLSSTNRYVDIGIPAGMLIGGIIGNNEQLRQNSLFVASSTAVSFGLNFLLKKLVKRRRPFDQNISITPVYRAEGYSFPSGHTSSSFATVTALSMAYPKWFVIIPSYLWAGSVSYSRMYLGVHYPSDVAAGTLLGVGSALSMSFIKK